MANILASEKSSGMPRQKKARKVGRTRLPNGAAKGKIVPVRFSSDDFEALVAAAKASNQSLSDWIRGTLNAAIQR